VRLAATLVAVEAGDGEYLGAMARWIGEELAPALHAAAGASVEAAVLRSWSGPRETPPAQPLSWEGQQYLVDPIDAELDRLRRLRAIQGPSGLDEALALSRALASVASAPGGDAARAAASALAGPASALVATPDGPLPALDPVDEVVGRLTSALAGGRHDAKAMGAALAPLWRHVDRALARALVSLAYTRHLGDPDTSVLTGDGLAERHEFGPPGMPSSAWSRPRDGGDETGRHLHGGLVGLDLALARLSLRRLSTDAIPPARTANENTIDEVRQTVTLSFRQPPTEAEVGAVAAALDKGRARVEAAERDAGALDRLAVEARVSEGRRSVLAWMVREEPDAVLAVFAPAELRRLGTEDPLPSAFGTSAADLGGCWCLRVPPARPWEHVSARPGQPRVAAQAVDLGLRLAAEMRALRLPAAVYPSLLALAAEEFLDRAATRFAEDWPALVEAAATLGRERVEDYVSGLAGTGPLRMRQEPTR
jgi:hypothetical protein